MPKKNITQKENILNTLVGVKAVESNDLIDSVTKMDKNVMKLFALSVAELDVKNPPEDRTVHLSKQLVFEFLQLSGNGRSSQLRKIVNNLHKETVFSMVENEEGFVFDTISPIEHTQFNSYNDRMSITFSPSGFPLLIGLKGDFTQYFILDLMNLTSKYSISLYRWISKNYNLYKNKVGDPEWSKESLDKYKNPYISFEDLRTRNGLEDKLKDYSNFFNKVISSPSKEITEFTSLDVEYEVVRRGRKGIGVKFYVNEKPQAPIPYKEDDPLAIESKEQRELRKQESLMQAMQSPYTKLLNERLLITLQDLTDVDFMIYMAEGVYPIYDKIKEHKGKYGGMKGVKKHMDHVLRHRIDYTEKNMKKYLQTSAENWLKDIPNHELKE